MFNWIRDKRNSRKEKLREREKLFKDLKYSVLKSLLIEGKISANESKSIDAVQLSLSVILIPKIYFGVNLGLGQKRIFGCKVISRKSISNFYTNYIPNVPCLLLEIEGEFKKFKMGQCLSIITSGQKFYTCIIEGGTLADQYWNLRKKEYFWPIDEKTVAEYCQYAGIDKSLISFKV